MPDELDFNEEEFLETFGDSLEEPTETGEINNAS